LRGIEIAKSVFGDAVQIDTVYNVGEWGNGGTDKFVELVIDGYDMIFACSFGYAQSLVQVALAVPQVKFEHCGGYVRSDNMSSYSAGWYEGRVPQGLIAGAVTQTNRIGYLGSFLFRRLSVGSMQLI
jgi:simple sugar transport system substrate-binding protein